MYYDAKECGKRIMRLRSRKKMTRVQLSFRVNATDRHLGAIERGERTASIDLLIELSEFFSTTLDYLILGKEEDVDKKLCMEKELRSIERHIEEIKSLL